MAVDAYFVILLFVECLFYTFHLSIVLLLIVKRKSKFEGAFYNIFRVVLVADFLSFICFLIVQRISMIPFFVELFLNNTLFPTFISFSIAIIAVIQFFGRFLMAFNRFTAIWFPFNYAKMWQRHWYTLLLFLMSFSVICWRLHEPVKYMLLPNGTFATVYSNVNLHQTVKVLSSSVYFLSTIAAAIVNGLSFAKFYYRRRKSVNYHLNEKHLLYMSIIIFIAQLFRTCLPLQQYLFPTNEMLNLFFAFMLPYLNDGLALSGSLSFFILSKTARKEYSNFYFNKKSNLAVIKSDPTIAITPTIL